MRIKTASKVKACEAFLKRTLIDEKRYGVQCKAIGKAIQTMNNILDLFQKTCEDNDLELKFRRKNYKEGKLEVEFVRLSIGPKKRAYNRRAPA